MNKLIYFFLLFSCVSVNAQERKLSLNFKQDDVFVLVDDDLVGVNSQVVKVDLNVNKHMSFYKKGYLSNKVTIDTNLNFNGYTVDLTQCNQDIKARQKVSLQPDTLFNMSNFTTVSDIDFREFVDQTFRENNYDISSGGISGQSEAYRMVIEVVEIKLNSSFDKAPRFVVAKIQLRWLVLDTQKNIMVYYKSTEGSDIVSVNKKKDLNESEIKERAIKGAIEEAQYRLLADDGFKGVFVAR